ncbi:hypothetical protein [Caloranaerobacter ferrireducens]|nr:hypothetical protein [Caloranaerobacter ferrireducens]
MIDKLCNQIVDLYFQGHNLQELIFGAIDLLRIENMKNNCTKIRQA